MTRRTRPLSAALLTVAGVAALLLSGCAIPPSGDGTAQPAAKPNQLDAAAIVGAFALLRQVPEPSGNNVVDFVKKLEAAKVSGSTEDLDLGVTGNKLADYYVTTQGGKGPMCAVVIPPKGVKGAPTQPQWALYFEPKSGEKSPLSLMVPGITTCDQAREEAKKITDNKDRDRVSGTSVASGRNAVLVIPTPSLTKAGQYMLDEARGFANSATPSK